MSTTETTAPTRNRDLFYEIAAIIEENPERHNQDVWEAKDDACGTTACVAGWACVLGRSDDFEIVKVGKAVFHTPTMGVVHEALDRIYRDHGRDPEGKSVEELAEWWGNYSLTELEEPEVRIDALGSAGYWDRHATELLGLTEDEASRLFDAGVGPFSGLTVAQALRAIGRGEDIENVWGYDEGDHDDDA